MKYRVFVFEQKTINWFKDFETLKEAREFAYQLENKDWSIYRLVEENNL